MTLKERIKQLADKQSISLPSLEAKLGFGNGTIVKWDKSTPNADKLNAVAKYFNVTMDYLLNGENNLPLPAEINNPFNINNVLIKNLDKYFADHPIKFHSNVIFLNELDNIQSEELDDMLQDTIGLSIKELNSILDRKHIPTSKELANILNGLNISIEELLELPYPPSYHHAKYDFIRATLCENGYILTGLDENTLLLGIHGNAYEINVTAYDTFVSSIDDYISLNLKQLTLNGKRNPELDAALDSFLD